MGNSDTVTLTRRDAIRVRAIISHLARETGQELDAGRYSTLDLLRGCIEYPNGDPSEEVQDGLIFRTLRDLDLALDSAIYHTNWDVTGD